MNLNNLKPIEVYPPATEKEIILAEQKISKIIPQIYRDFLKITNGMLLDNCVFYGTETIAEMYKTHEFSEYAPDYISVGNDNGDREIIIKAEKDAVLCGLLDAGSIGTDEPNWFDFAEWLENGCEFIEEYEIDLARKGKICIVRIPDEKTKFLTETKKIFSLAVTASELMKGVKTLPYTIVEDITGARAQKLINETSFRECYKFL